VETVTTDPVVEVNGENTGVDGMLAEGETVALDANVSWLREGTNRVNVSTTSPSSGPASLVGLEYSARRRDNDIGDGRGNDVEPDDERLEHLAVCALERDGDAPDERPRC